MICGKKKFSPIGVVYLQFSSFFLLEHSNSEVVKKNCIALKWPMSVLKKIHRSPMSDCLFNFSPCGVIHVNDVISA